MLEQGVQQFREVPDETERRLDGVKEQPPEEVEQVDSEPPERKPEVAPV